MKARKIFIAVIIILLILLLFALAIMAIVNKPKKQTNAFFEEQVELNGVTYELNLDRTGYVVVDYDQEATAEELTILDSIPGQGGSLPVVEVAYGAFEGKTTTLKKVVLGKNVTKIADRAFYECPITEFVFNEKLNHIGAYAFYNCKLSNSIVLPNKLEILEEYAFYGNNDVAEVHLPSGLNYLGDGSLPSNISSFLVYENLIYIGNTSNPFLVLCDVQDKTLPSYTINPRCKFIYTFAFKDCVNLTEISIPDSVVGILRGAFEGCSSLNNVVLPNNLEYIEDESFSEIKNNLNYNIFENCNYLGSNSNPYLLLVEPVDKSLKSITIHPNCKAIYHHAFHILGLTEISIPNGLVFIGMHAFCYASFSSFELPDSVKYLSDYSFGNCSKLTTIKFSNSLRIIRNFSFVNCTALTSIVIPQGVEKIEQFAFHGARKSLVSIELPSSVEFMGNSVFDGVVSGKESPLTTIVINSAFVYKNETNNASYGSLTAGLKQGAKIKVLNVLVERFTNDYLNNAELFTKTVENGYTIFTKI